MTEEKEPNVIFNEEYVEPIYQTKTNKISAFTHVVGVVYSSYVLVIIFFASLVRVFNTAILNVTSEGVLHDLKLSDSFFGAISGPISSIATIFFGIVVGRSSDLYSRKYLFLFCVFVWTIFQVLTGFSQNYWHLMFCKIGSAAGMGGLNPINFSLITDYFQPSRRPIAFGLQGTSLIFGIGGAFLFGALATENSSNWRELFFFSAIPGAVVAVLIFFTVNEPERGALDERKDTKKSPDITNLSIFLAKRPSLWLMCLGGAFGFLGANAINTFNTIFYRRVHGISANELSSWLSWISPLGGLGGSIFGAILCVIAQKFTQRGYALVCLFGSIMSIPFQLSSLLVPNPYLSLLLYLPASFFQFIILVPINLMVVQIVPVSGRGFAVALFGVFVTGLGSVGPLLVGALSTANFPLFDYADNPYSIRWSLILVNIGTRMILISCIFVLIIFLPYDIKALNTYYDKVAVVEEIEKLVVEEDENETKGLIQS